MIVELQQFYASKGPERCGFILKDNSVIEVENVSGTPDVEFVVSTEDIILYENEAKATWHTHPGASSNLSNLDADGFKMWPEWDHYIVGRDGVRRFYISDGKVLQHV